MFKFFIAFPSAAVEAVFEDERSADLWSREFRAAVSDLLLPGIAEGA